MDEMGKVEIQVKTQMMIKPSSPTPHHKKSVKLSLMDQKTFPYHIMLLVYYSAPKPINSPDISDRLKTSLSEILTKFYPYAGRIVDNSSIECTDEGVVYTEAAVNCNLSDIISKHNNNNNHAPIKLNHFLPELVRLNEVRRIPLIIQTNVFKCGGFALGVMGSHKIMDGFGLCNFVRNWALISSVDHNYVFEDGPDFAIPSSLYPPSDVLNIMPEPLGQYPVPISDTCVTKSFVFKGASIDELKVKIGTTPRPTCVEAVSALIWKCAMKSSRSLFTKLSSSIWGHAVNTRRRWEVPLPENTPGNHSCSFYLKKDNDTNEIDDEQLLTHLVSLFKNGLKQFCDNHKKKKLQDSLTNRSHKETEDLTKRDDIDLYLASSWCGFKLYNADFGWGGPEWIGFCHFPVKNVIFLMDTKEGDGIEAWISLEEEHMVAFEQDEDLLMFASHPTLHKP